MKKILVAINNNTTLNDLVGYASKIAKIEKAKLTVVYVYEVPRTLALDAEIPDELEKGNILLDDAVQITEKYGIDVNTDLIQARAAGPGITDEARDLGIELIIMAMSQKPNFGEVYFGNTVTYVLKNAVCQVMIVRQSLVPVKNKK